MAEKLLDPGTKTNYGTEKSGKNVATNVCDNFERLTYQHVTYDIPTVNLCGVYKFKQKRILTDVSGIMYPGLNAIMGPTGSGKTTLMDVLAARKVKSNIRGQILVNEEPLPYYFKCITGYVVQDDCLEKALSVRENIFFSANLRLPFSTSLSTKRARVQNAIDKLGLTSVADRSIGNAFHYNISGGERKRTNIAMELVISPKILFLDEPTTGLDAYTAVQLIHQLKALSNEGKIIITAIHQPRHAIYNLFDSITLLSKGRTVYHGEAKQALNYLAKLGYDCPDRENPADFFLDVIAQDELRIEATPHDHMITCLADQYDHSDVKNTIVGQLNRRVEQHINRDENREETQINSAYATNIIWQILVVSQRTLKNLIRTPLEFFLQQIINVAYSLVIGGLYWQLGLDSNGLQNRIGAIFLIVMSQIFANISGLNTFHHGKVLFVHENASGYYRVSAYFFANLLLDLFPKRLIPVAVGGTILYFMIGFQVQIRKFLIFILTLMLTTIAAAGFPLLYGASMDNLAVANLMTGLTFVMMMIFSGLLVNITTLPEWIQWIQYSSLFRLAISTLSINELLELEFNQTETKGSGKCGSNVTNLTLYGECYLQQQGIHYGEPFDIWRGVVGLAGFGLILLTLTYLVLLCIKKEK